MRTATAFLVVACVLVASVIVLPREAKAERTLVQQWPTFPDGTAHLDDDVRELEYGYLPPFQGFPGDAGYNPTLTAGDIRPTNVFGDNFRTTSVDGETWRMLAPIFPGCADAGTQSITAVDTGGVDSNDGSLVFNHNAAESSTRVTRAKISASGDFTLEIRVRFDTTFAGGNFTFVATTISSNATLHWCGGYNAATSQSGGGIYVVNGGTLKTARAFILDPSGVTNCGASDLIPNDNLFRIRRTADVWQFRMSDRSAYRTCSGTSSPVYGTFDLVSTGVAVSAVDYYRTYYEDLSGVNMGGTQKSSMTANFTFESTGGVPYERITSIDIFVYKCPDKGGKRNDPSIGNFELVDDTTWTVLYSPASWSGLYVIPTDESFYRVLTIPAGAVTTDGPYRFRIGTLWTEDYNCVSLIGIVLHLTGDIPPPPPPPPPPGGEGLLGSLDEFIGLGICGMIGVLILITFFVIAGEIKKRKGGE